jgi:GDP-L-fucose synthase
LEPTNHPYGLSKLALLTYVQAAQQQYGLQYLFPILCNLYGPSNEADRQNSHVIPAMILKCLDAKYGKSKEITVWGSGSPTREFLFVADAASAIMTAISQGGTGIYNVGSKEVKTISKLVEIIAELTGCSGIPIKYDKLKPDGQMNRLLHSSQFMNAFNWQPLVSMADGLKQTIASIEGKYGGNS